VPQQINEKEPKFLDQDGEVYAPQNNIINKPINSSQAAGGAVGPFPTRRIQLFIVFTRITFVRLYSLRVLI
jgi:hypothetical protein